MLIRLNLRHRTPPQKRISESLARFNVGVWGRQSGKTTYGLDKLIYRPLQGRPYGKYWYILQTYSAARVAFDRYKQVYLQSPGLFARKPHESQLSFTLINGAEVAFKSGNNYQDLRAQTLDGAIIDEVRQQHKDLWPLVIRPMLARRKGWCDFLSTPNGFEHFYDLYEFAKAHPEEWATFHAPSSEAPWWTEEEIASARSSMTDDEFAQEILAEFREIGVGKAYKKHGLWNQETQNPLAIRGMTWSPYLPIVVGLDFNVALMAWQLCQHRAGDFYFGDEIAVENTDTEEMAKLLCEKVKGHKPGVILIGDATGNARKTASVGKTDYSIIISQLKAHGIPCRNLTPEANPPVKDRVNMVNSRLKAADGSVHLFYHPTKCKRLKKDFERVATKTGTDGFILDQKKDPLLTHASDGAGYVIAYYAPEWRKSVGTLKVIPR